MSVQHTVSRTWRMTTTGGSYLIKELWPDSDPDWAPQLDERMIIEQRAAAAGIRTPPTVLPAQPAYGWSGRVAGRGAYRVTEWIDHRKVTEDDDLSDWLGRVLAILHGLERYRGDLQPLYYLHAPETWREWVARAQRRHRPWATRLAEHLDDLLAITGRLRRTYLEIGDHVITHRDLVPFNVLLTAAEPVLIDWEVVGPDSASLEAGFAAATFGRRDAGYVRRILDSYRAHGGVLVGGLGESLFAHKLGSEVGRLAAMISDTLDGRPLTGWQTRYADPDEGVSRLIDEVMTTAERLDRLAAELRV